MSKKLKKILVISASVILALLIAIQIMVSVIYCDIFGDRLITSEKYVRTAGDIASYKQENGDFTSDKGFNLHGVFYLPEGEAKAIVVLNHGFGGGGYISYMPQMKVLTDNGYMVYAFDKTGNDNSEGDKVYGLPQGVIDLEYALDFVRENEISKDLPIMLYGHSWGGYSVCSVLQDEKDIKAVVSLAGFNTSVSMMEDYIGESGKLFAPFLAVCDFFRFGKYAFKSSEQGLSSSDTNVLVIHGGKDDTVIPEHSFDIYKTSLSDKSNIQFLSYDSRTHDVFLSDEATDYNKFFSEKLKQERDKYKTSEEAYQAVMAEVGYDEDKSVELDMQLMNTIVEFFDNALED